MSDKQEVTSKVRKQFGAHAQNYVNSKVFWQGEDLNIILRMAQPQRHHAVLDIATGGGHTALKLAPHVKSVVASDITQKMLDAAEAFITPQADNVTFKLADAEDLPFEDATFDVVTCRIAPHHFPDIFKFVLESTRVLKRGGVLVVQDGDVPADERAAEYVNAFEKLRDPSHVRMYSSAYWRGTFLDAQLEVEQMDTDFVQHANFRAWCERMSCPPDVVERLTVMMQQAPDAMREWMQPTAVGTDDAMFEHRYVILAGRKPV
ncbi:MAG: class I SAM-dependent methyltransferase [Chloroflexota bacterium]